MYCFNMKMSLFVITVISQGSVATDLRFVGQCNNHFVANLLRNSTVKKVENRLIFVRVMDRSRDEVLFLTHSVVVSSTTRIFVVV